MPRLVHSNPTYRKHHSGQAFVLLDGKHIYLGPHGTKASRDAYDRFIGEWLANGRRLKPDAGSTVKVADLILAYWKHIRGYYRNADGVPTGEAQNQKPALRLLKKLCATTPAGDFGPLSMKAIRQKMIEAGLSRSYINKQIGHVRRCFKWGVENELVPPAVYHGLLAVGGLRKGRSDAKETAPVKPVPEEYVQAIKDFVSPQVWAMIELQLVTGMRPGELVIMRGCDIDTSAPVWIYKPTYHKTEHHQHSRVIYLGPRAKEIIEPFLKPDVTAYLFSPRDAEAHRHAAAKCHRRPNQKPNTRASRRRVGNRYDTDSYRRAIARACRKANSRAKGGKIIKSDVVVIPAWHPHQLRHNAATRLRREFGLDATRTVLGQKTLQVAEVYAEQDQEKARKIMAEVG